MPDTLLLKPEQLQALLERLEERNAVIHELSQENERDANTTARQTLAFWLGNSVLLSRLLVANGNPSELIRGYLCFLELDKKISRLNQLDAQQKTINDLRHCQLELLLYFNSNHSLFNERPDTFFAEFKRIVQTIDPNSANTLAEKNLFIETQKECLAILNNDAIQHHTDLQTRTKPGLSSLVTLRPNLSEYMVRRVSTNYNLRLFVNEQTNPEYPLSVQLIQGRGGILLERLLVKNKRHTSDTIVLAQISRTSFQGAYLQNRSAEFCAFFKTNVLFLNHRNYSTRSECNAQSIYELAQDVFDTAMHFHKLNQQVVLYGMCGGAPHTLLAAYLLKRNNIPFKLIIDRFATDYGAFRSSSTLNRKMTLTHIHNPALCFVPLKDRVQIQGYLLLQIIYGLFIYLLLGLARTNINAAHIIRMLPAEDVLLLQARPPLEQRSTLRTTQYIPPRSYEG